MIAPERKKFKCRACNWKFSRNFTPLLCPYCGKQSIVLDIPQSADQLVREVEELRV
ncbi:hypothetical protein HY484_02655 [Candidatus Woesearchaeota archaeon]|nr:hypothetical protein [Candidatus Woesearchaeota archaeon]